MTLLIVYLLIALLISFLCSILEAVLLSSTTSYIETLSNKYNQKTVNLLMDLKSNIDKPISSILILNTFAHTMGAAGVGAQAQLLFGEEWQAVIAFVLTLLILYFSEIIPKTIGALYWKSLIVPCGYIITFFIKVSYPLVILSTYITYFLSKGKGKDSLYTRDEIKAVISIGEKEGSILAKESNLIDNLFKLKEIKTKDIMTPRSVVFALEAKTKIGQAIDEESMYIYSRIPIYDETIDNIVGIVFNITILEESNEERDDVELSTIMQPVFQVSENIPISMLIDLFIKKQTHLFIVHDSFGQTSGVVTLEDAIETLLGVEIIDEMDQVADLQAFAKNRNKKLQQKMLLRQKNTKYAY